MISAALKWIPTAFRWLGGTKVLVALLAASLAGLAVLGYAYRGEVQARGSAEANLSRATDANEALRNAIVHMQESIQRNAAIRAKLESAVESLRDRARQSTEVVRYVTDPSGCADMVAPDDVIRLLRD